MEDDGINVITLKPTARQQALINCKADTIFFGGARGGGKASPVYENIVTPFGIKKLGDLKVGDIISGKNGKPQKVIGVYDQGMQDIYNIHFIDGAKCMCTLDHLWVAKKTCAKSKLRKYVTDGNPQDADWRCWTFGMIKEWLDRKANAPEGMTIKNQNLLIPLCDPVQFTKSYKYDMRPIDPYILGLLIGNGCLTLSPIGYVTQDECTVDYMRKFYDVTYERTYHYRIRDNNIKEYLKKLNLLGCVANCKFIPESYKLSSIEERMELLRGLLDSDGTADDRGHVSYCTVSRQLAKDIQWVVWSLGGKATVTESPAGYRSSVTGEYVECQLSYDVYINTKFNTKLFKVERKRQRCKDEFNGGGGELHRRIVGYEYVGKAPARCIAVSNPDSLYIAGDFCVTHNTYGSGISVLSKVGKYGEHYSGIFFRRTNSELEEAIKQYMEVFGSAATWKSGDRLFKFWNGAVIKMRFLDSFRDTRNYQGHQYCHMIFDEVTNFDNWNMIQQMRGCLRSAYGIPTQFLMSGNPGGPLHMKLKQEFINPCPQGDMLIPDTYDKDLKRMTYKCFIPSLLQDNPYLANTGYAENLRKVGTPEQIQQWLYGNWDVSVNAAFSDLWTPPVHVVKPFKIPETWKIVKSYDYGSSHPWACVWFAISDGSDFKSADGQWRPTIAGDIFAVRELYGCVPNEVNVGDKASIQSQAEQIKYIESTVFAGREIMMSIADSAIFASSSGAYCIAADFENYGIYWERCNKFPGSREQGFILMRERLLASVERDGKPGIFWFRNCLNSIRTLPEMQMDRDGTDRVATGNSSEDHLYDAHCYLLLTNDYGQQTAAANDNF